MLTVLLEAYLVMRVGSAYWSYHSKLAALNATLGEHQHLFVPETAKIAAFVFVAVCLLKLIMAVGNYTHASNRTDRTVEAVNGHKSLMTKVTVISLVLSGVTVVALNMHKGNLVHVATVVDSLKQSVYMQMALHLIGHYLMIRLNLQESKLPRIVDLKAHQARI